MPVVIFTDRGDKKAPHKESEREREREKQLRSIYKIPFLISNENNNSFDISHQQIFPDRYPRISSYLQAAQSFWAWVKTVHEELIPKKKREFFCHLE